MKQFDDIFSRKVKEAFNNYNADHLAEDGWNAYVRKHGSKRRRVIIFPLWAKAATIAVLVTIGVLFTARINHRNGGESATPIAQESRSELADSALKKKDTASAGPEISATNPVTAIASPLISVTNPVITKASPLISAATPEITEASPSISAATPVITATKPVTPAEFPVMASPGQASETAIAAEMSAWVNLSDNPTEIRLIDDADTRLKLKLKETPQVYGDIPRDKMTTTIMGGLSGMMARIDNEASASQGVSIGFYVEQQLTRRISVRPGLAMAKHNYAMGSMSGGGLVMDYATPELSGMSGTATSYEADIEVVSMEIPVNFVFSIRKRARSNLFVSTGVSTVFYLSQHMSGSINNTYTRSTVDSYGEVSYESMTTSVIIESDQELLNRIDFLGLANFSAGYSLPFGKTSHLLFEPFIQLPVKDLTSLDLRIRYGGLSMKIQF